MTIAYAVTLVLSAPVTAEDAPVAVMTMPALAGALMRADGSVDLVIGVSPGPEKLVEMLDLLSVSTATQIRLSALYDPETLRVTSGQKAILSVFRDYIAVHGLDWHVCEGWWGTPGREHLSRRVIDEFGGSLIFIDNGPSSDLIDNPSSDLSAAVANDPVFASLFKDAEWIVDGEEYWNAVEAVWSQVMLDNALDPARRGAGRMGADMTLCLAVQDRNGLARLSLMGALLIAMAVLIVHPVGAQEADTTVIGIEQLNDSERIARLEAENKQFREALIALDERSRNTARTLDELVARIGRGEQPLVALEIEQLWTVVRALEADNTALQEALDALAGGN
ncbi:MAG: hypothetical protein HC844_04415 [Tabrizicola sp.]|nr:hypothetical protein [Tabrizicola sp.]